MIKWYETLWMLSVKITSRCFKTNSEYLGAKDETSQTDRVWQPWGVSLKI